MKKTVFTFGAALALALSAQAQLVLDTFNAGSATGAINPSSSWVGNVTQNQTTITVSGSAKNDSGWRSTFNPVDYSSWSFVAVTAQLDAGNIAPSFVVGFADDNGDSQGFSVLTSSFQVGVMSTIFIPIAWTTMDPSLVVRWSIGGGVPSPGASDFRMTFDELAFTMSNVVAPIPEPSTYAAIVGALALGFVAYRRRAARVA